MVGHFSGTAGQIESIQFADSTVWDANVIAARTAAGTANAMIGTAGNDVFVVDHAGDTITEGIDQGIDTAQASVHYSLGANVENLTLTGPLNLTGYGNVMANSLAGNSADNRLTGAGGI